jgi:hypothetical protein
MAEAGRQRAVNEFARDTIMQAYVALYHYLLEHRR